MNHSMPAPSARRRRPWLIATPLILVLVLAAGWTGFWFYAAAQAETILAEWRAREAKAGRQLDCAEQRMGGFPFRIELTCTAPRIALTDRDPAIHMSATRFLAAGQIYDPTLLIAEIAGPMTITMAGAPSVRANWHLAQLSVRGLPEAPQRVSVVLHDAAIDRIVGNAAEPLLRAARIDAHARLVGGSVDDKPVVEAAVNLVGATAPNLHPVANDPLDLFVGAVLRGLDNLQPKPLTMRLRQLQAAGGRLQVTEARLRQGDVRAVAKGTLGLSPSGRLDGALEMTTTGLERMLSKLGIDEVVGSDGASQLAPAFSALDRLLPGLGQVARNNAGVGVAAGLAIVGRPAKLDGQEALAVPLRLVDGTVFIGPLRVGEIRPLY